MNKLVLMGRLTKEPQVAYTKDQKMIVRFTLAVNRRGVKDKTDFLEITAFGKNAEFVSKYYKKGQQVAIVGRVQNNNYTDDKGIKHYSTMIVCDECYFADSKKENVVQTPADIDFDASTENAAEMPADNYNYDDDLPW